LEIIKGETWRVSEFELNSNYQIKILKKISKPQPPSNINHPKNLVAEIGILRFICGNKISVSESSGNNPKSCPG